MKNMYDVVIIGGGPSGLAAGIYLARANYRVVIVEKNHFGGQITITSEVVNYPGVKKVSGQQLADNMLEQAKNFGAEFMLAEVTGFDLTGDIKKVKTTKGELECFGILLAVGASPRMVGFKGEAEFKGKGIAYCATCDGEFFKGKDVYVVGGGFAAAEESVFLTKYANNVTILVREDYFTCAETVAQKAINHPKIKVEYNKVVNEVRGNDKGLTYLSYKDTKTNEEKIVEKDGFGVFVFAGYAPATSFLKDVIDLNEQGYIITDKSQKTSVDGVYASGDVCIKPLRQVVTAVSEGAIAATELERVCAHLQEKTNIIPTKPVVEVEQKVESSSFFDSNMLAQLNTVFGKMENSVTIKVDLNDNKTSNELENYMKELSKLTSKIKIEYEVTNDPHKPVARIYNKDDKYTGLAFHGVPGGHEFTSFILGIYNCSGKGQPIDLDVYNKIVSNKQKLDLKVIVSLSCTMCPELVIASQRLASLNENITTEVYDINNYEDIKNKYNIMSVPCMIVNDERVHFGKKNIIELIDLLNI